jgi:hypothetical protein
MTDRLYYYAPRETWRDLLKDGWIFGSWLSPPHSDYSVLLWRPA